MSKKYRNLLSPLKVGSKIARTRFLYPCALPHFLQGPERFPAEPMIDYYTNLAKNGSSIICFHDFANDFQRNSPGEDGKRFPMYDLSDPSVENYYCQLNDNVRYFGGLMVFEMFGNDCMPEYEVVDMEMAREQRDMMMLIDPGFFNKPKQSRPEFGFQPRKEFPREAMEEMISEGVKKCRYYKGLGFAGCTIEISRGRFGSFMDDEANTRTDEYNGSVANRARLILEIMRRIKTEAGEDFLVIGNFASSDYKAAYEDKIEYLRILEPYMDLIHIRSRIAQTGYDGKKEDYLTPQALTDSINLKKSGVKTPVCAWTGFQDPQLMEDAIAAGAVDMISCARMFISNSDIGKLLEEGRGEDVVPCVLCNKCHGVSLKGDWLCACTVNPRIGIEHRLGRLKSSGAKAPKKVTVIGGGPVGMRAALFACRDGHSVTLFEASDALGGQLKTAKYPSFKWPMANYIEFLIRQVEKATIDVRLSTRATPDMIRREGFDVVICATGAAPKNPAIPGVEAAKWNPHTVYGNSGKIGKRVVCIGGSESSVEAGLYLAGDCGHEVTVLSRQGKLLYDANPIHYPEMVLGYARELPNFKSITYATTTQIEPGRVTYKDRDGAEHIIECDDVVAAGGVQPRMDEALAFSDAADKFFIIGDASGTNNIWRGNRDAFAVVSQI